MFKYSIALLFLVDIVISVDVKEYKHVLQSCELGDVVQNDCIQCICKTEKYYECQSLKSCSEKSINDDNDKNGSEEQSCHPNTIYVHKTATCICSDESDWPHDHCKQIFRTLLPSNTTRLSCEPNTYVTIDCNVCFCGPTGLPDRNRCTRNKCEEDIVHKSRRSTTANTIYGNCEAKNWYSLSPCQFCYCAHENRLVCNTANNYKKLSLGTYSLSFCGKDLIKEALELVPNVKGLRNGKNDIVTSLKTTTTKTTTLLPSLHDQSIYREQKESKENEADETSSSSSSEDEFSKENFHKQTTIRTSTPKTVARKGTTGMPYDEDDDDDNANYYENDRNYVLGDESDNGLGVPIQAEVRTEDKGSKIPSTTPNSTASDSLQGMGDHLATSMKINLPLMIDKVFKMAFRKSMISLGETCQPGSFKMEECNVCACMKNNKMLCTTNKCE